MANEFPHKEINVEEATMSVQELRYGRYRRLVRVELEIRRLTAERDQLVDELEALDDV